MTGVGKNFFPRFCPGSLSNVQKASKQPVLRATSKMEGSVLGGSTFSHLDRRQPADHATIQLGN